MTNLSNSVSLNNHQQVEVHVFFVRFVVVVVVVVVVAVAVLMVAEIEFIIIIRMIVFIRVEMVVSREWWRRVKVLHQDIICFTQPLELSGSLFVSGIFVWMSAKSELWTPTSARDTYILLRQRLHTCL